MVNFCKYRDNIFNDKNEFEKSEYNYQADSFDEYEMSGRKSSFINTMVGRKNLARTSNVPGKTRQINFYNIDNEKAATFEVDRILAAYIDKNGAIL